MLTITLNKLLLYGHLFQTDFPKWIKSVLPHFVPKTFFSTFFSPEALPCISEKQRWILQCASVFSLFYFLSWVSYGMTVFYLNFFLPASEFNVTQSPTNSTTPSDNALTCHCPTAPSSTPPGNPDRPSSIQVLVHTSSWSQCDGVLTLRPLWPSNAAWSKVVYSEETIKRVKTVLKSVCEQIKGCSGPPTWMEELTAQDCQLNQEPSTSLTSEAHCYSMRLRCSGWCPAPRGVFVSACVRAWIKSNQILLIPNVWIENWHIIKKIHLFNFIVTSQSSLVLMSESKSKLFFNLL